MQKRGQLGIIEMQYFMWGFAIGLLSGFILAYLGTAKVIPFKIPAICGTVFLNKEALTTLNKKAQLGIIEAKYFMMGFVVGIIGAFVLTYLGTAGILGFKIPLVCG